MMNTKGMTNSYTAAARSAAGFGACSAAMSMLILDAILVASIFVVLRLCVLDVVLVSVLSVVLVLVLVRISVRLVIVAPLAPHTALQT